MFRPELTRPADHPILQEAEARAFGTLLSTIVQCQQGGELPPGDPRHLAAVCWSAVHGLAVLHVEQVLRETPLSEIPIEELARSVVQAAMQAVQHPAPGAPDPPKPKTAP
jgi:hypothetical protein